MAAASTRTIKIRIDGDEAGLKKATTGAIRDVKNLKEKVEDAGGSLGARLGAKMGDKFGGILPDAVGNAFSALPPQVQGAVSVAGLAIAGVLAPLIGAAVSSGILLGIGGLALGAGIFGAFKFDPVAKEFDGIREKIAESQDKVGDLNQELAVTNDAAKRRELKKSLADANRELDYWNKQLKDAQAEEGANSPVEQWRKVRGTLKEIAQDFSQPFMQPMVRAAGTVNDALKRMSPSFQRIAEATAPLVDKLVPGLTKMAENAMPGIESAIKASAPLFEKLSEHLPKIGKSISDFFALVGEGSPGATLALDHLLTIVEGAIVATGAGLAGLSKAYKAIVDGASAAKDWIVARFGEVKDFFAGIPGAISSSVSLWWGIVKLGASTAYTWVTGKLNSVVSYVTGLPGRISRAANGMWDGVKNAFKSALNWVIRKWNNLSFRVPGFSAFGVSVPGFSLSTPDIGYLARGGAARAGRSYIVGERGPELLTMGSTGGRVTPNHELGGDVHVAVYIDGEALTPAVVKVMRERDRGLRRRVRPAVAGAGAY